MLRVEVAGIPRPGLQVPVDLGVDWVREAVQASMDAEPTAIQGELDVKVTSGRRVVVHGRLKSEAAASCDRCGEACLRTVDTEISLAYLPGRDEVDADLELGADDLNIGWYEGGVLDLSDVLREATALALPSRTVCLDSAGCDARTRALLEAGGRVGPSGHEAFAALRQLQ